MSKHTKGPWRIQMLGNQQADLISGGTFMGLTGGSGAPFDYEPDDAAEWEANVRLIVASPTLLEACKAAEEWLSGWASASPYIDVIRAAIQEAEGVEDAGEQARSEAEPVPSPATQTKGEG